MRLHGWKTTLTAMMVIGGAVGAAPAAAVVPVNYGTVTGPVTLVTPNAPGNQTDPRVDDDLVVYADHNDDSIHYWKISSGATNVIPHAVGERDTVPDVRFGRVVFGRADGAGRPIELFETATGLGPFELLPPVGGVAAWRLDPVIADRAVAFQDNGAGLADIMVSDLGTGSVQQLTNGPELDEHPQIASSGNVIVWRRCPHEGERTCDVYKGLRSDNRWTVAHIAATGIAGSADTDGDYIVFDADLGGSTGQDIYWTTPAGGPATRIELPGVQQSPRIVDGKIVFQTVTPTGATADVYDIASNRILRVAAGPQLASSPSDIHVLPTGQIRVAYVLERSGATDVFLRRFTLPPLDTTAPAVGYTITGTLGDNGWYTSDVRLTWTVREPETPATTSGCTPRTITSDQVTGFTCTATSAGGTAAVPTTIRRDASPPDVSPSAHPATYTVADTVAITCAASDAMSGIAIGCRDVGVAAWELGLGPNAFEFTASDLAGNMGSASAGFSVVVDPRSLTALTTRLVQASREYQALTAGERRVVDAQLRTACAPLGKVPNSGATAKSMLVTRYRETVRAFADADMLREAEAQALSGFVDAL